MINLLFVALLTLLSSCQHDESRLEPNILRINFQDGDLPSVHPHIGIDYRMRSLQSALFEGLTRLDKDGNPKPAAAASITLSPDQTRYTFTLRPTTWSNGRNVTAKHFESAWLQAISKESSCRRPDLFYIIKNAEKVKKGECDISQAGIQALDEKTLQIDLEHPAPYFLELISNPIFSPLFDSIEEPSVFNGPFAIETWDHDQLIRLKKNPLYWDALSVELDRIEILFVTDALTAVQLFEKGELDWIGSPFSCLPSEMIPSLQNKGMLQAKEVARIYWLYCNDQLPVLHNTSIRKALSYAIDRKAITDHVLIGQAYARSPLPNSLTLLKDRLLPVQGDVEQAHIYFAQGLAELDLTPETFPTLTLSHSHIIGQRQLAEIIQSNWRNALGIEVVLKGSEWNVFFSDLSNGKYEIGGCIKSALYRDPIYHLELLEEKGHAYNVSRWEDQRYKTLLAQARVALNSLQREECLRKAESILNEQMPVIPIYSENYLYLIRPHIKNVVIHDLGQVDFKWISCAKQ